MNDPHVVALVYRIEHDESIDYARAATLCHDDPRFQLRVEDGKARFQMRAHFPTITEADEALAEFRRTWEFSAQLKHGPGSFRLVLDRGACEIVDRNPTPNHIGIEGKGVAVLGAVGPVKLTAGPPAYPDPPSDIALTPDVETMHNHYMRYRRGEELLGSMAYFCLTKLEASAGGKTGRRPRAAEMYRIDEQVLRKIGDLTANKGGAEARKAEGVAKEFSSQERKFLQQAMKAIIRRMAQRAHSPKNQLEQISMSDLPALETVAKQKKGIT